MRHAFTFAVASVALLGAATAAHADFIDTFDTIDPAWSNDRYAPDSFNLANLAGENVVNLGISDADSSANRPGAFSSTFYNTQGKQRLTGISGTSGYISGDLYVSNAFAANSSQLVRTDIWTRDSATDENDAFYGIIGLINNDAADPFNNAAANRSLRLRVWDQNTSNGWVDIALSNSFALEAWHNLAIATTPTTVSYLLDGNVVYTQAAISLPGNETLKQVFLQAYNFGTGDYGVAWDNVTAVPEPATMSLLGLAAMGLLARRRMA